MKNTITLLAQLINPKDINAPTVAANNANLQAILNTVYFWAGIAAVIIIVFGGILYITSAGSAEKTKRAKDAIFYAVIGLIVIILAFAITNLVIGSIKT